MADLLSNKVNRIKVATDTIRNTVGATSETIEDVATATTNKINTLNADVEAKTSALVAKEAELNEVIQNKEAEIATAVTEATAAKDIVIAAKETELAAKETELAAKQIELDEAIQNREVAITEAVNEVKKNITAFKVDDAETMEAKTDAKEDDVCSIVTIEKGFPNSGQEVKSCLLNSVVKLDKPFGEWLTDLYTQAGVDPNEPFLAFMFDNDEGSEMMYIDIQSWDDRCDMSIYYQNNKTDSYASVRFYPSLTAKTVRAQEARTREEDGTETDFKGDSIVKRFEGPLTMRGDMHPGTLLDKFVYFISQEYDGTYRYSEVEGGWIKIPVGMTLKPEKVIKDVEYLTDDGVKTGTFGNDIGSTAQFPTFAEFMKSIPSTGWEPSGYTSATEVMNLLHAGRDGWNPLVHCINWNSSKFNSFSAKAGMFKNVKVDEFSFDKIPGSYFNKPALINTWFAGSSIGNIDFSALDISALQSIQNPYAGVKYSQIKDWLSEEKTFELLGGFTNSVLGGIIHDLDETVPLTVKNRTYKEAYLFMSCFGGIQSKHLLLENIKFEKQITRYDYMFASNSILQSICIRNVDVDFKTDTTGVFYYSNAKDMFSTATALKYIIIDNDEVLNFPAHHSYSYMNLYCQSGLEKTPVYTSGAIFVKDALVSSYKSHKFWSYFSSRIKPISEMPAELKAIYGYTE